MYKGCAVMLVALVAMVAMGGGCGSTMPTTRPVELPPVVSRNSDNGGQVKLAVDQKLVIRLASNPTTGFTWKIAVLDTRCVRPLGEDYFEGADPQMIGAGGTQVFTFKSVKKGKTAIVLDYLRPWEKDVPATTTYTLNVVVE